MALSWDQDAPFCVDLAGRHPRFRIRAEAQKSGRDQLLPMTPDFAMLLLQTPEAERTGRVFLLRGLLTGEPMCTHRVGRIVSKIGRKAGILVARPSKTRKVVEVVDGEKREVEREVVKYASAHDLRRAFGTRWARRLAPRCCSA